MTMAPRTGLVSAMSASRTTAWYQSANRLRSTVRARCIENSEIQRVGGTGLTRPARPEQAVCDKAGKPEKAHQGGHGQRRGGGGESAHAHGGHKGPAIEENADQRRGHARRVSEMVHGEARRSRVDRAQHG